MMEYDAKYLNHEDFFTIATIAGQSRAVALEVAIGSLLEAGFRAEAVFLIAKLEDIEVEARHNGTFALKRA